MSPGYGAEPEDVPVDLRQALLVLVAYWFEHRDAVIVAGSGAVVPAGFDRHGGAVPAGAAVSERCRRRRADRPRAAQRREMTAEDEGGHVALFVPVATLWARVTATGARRRRAGRWARGRR